MLRHTACLGFSFSVPELPLPLSLLQTDNIAARIASHRMKEATRNAAFAYIIMPDKSSARMHETRMIVALGQSGVRLTNSSDQAHKHFGSAAARQRP